MHCWKSFRLKSSSLTCSSQLFSRETGTPLKRPVFGLMVKEKVRVNKNRQSNGFCQGKSDTIYTLRILALLFIPVLGYFKKTLSGLLSTVSAFFCEEEIISNEETPQPHQIFEEDIGHFNFHYCAFRCQKSFNNKLFFFAFFFSVWNHNNSFSLFILFLFYSSSESRERAYDHSPYGHHERSGTFDRQRHYNADYYRDRTMFAAAGPGSSAIGGSFEASDPHFDSRIRDPFTLTNATRRDLYRDDRGRRVDRTYHHRRSRSSHSSQSRHPSPQRTTGQTPKTPHSPKRAPLSPGRGPRSQSRSRSSSSDSVSSTSSTGSGRWDTFFVILTFHVQWVWWLENYMLSASTCMSKCLIDSDWQVSDHCSPFSFDKSDSNSSSSDGSRARSVQSSATHAPTQSSMVLESDEPRRSFGIKVQNLPVRSTGELSYVWQV